MSEINSNEESSSTEPSHAVRVENAETQNFLALVAHQVMVRVAWVFKTESVLIPAFLDSISGAGWVRGCLPILNRIGQSFAPLWLADRIQTTAQKKWFLFLTTWLMGVPLLILTGMLWWLDGEELWAFPVLFLALYTFFFAATGVNRVVYGTLQGKLIPAQSRGRLLGVAGMVGSIASVAALLLVQNYINIEGSRLFLISFGISGAGMVLAGLTCLGINEPRDHYEPSHNSFKTQLKEARNILRKNHAFRRLVIVSMLTITILLIFPHYQTFARERLGELHVTLMTWVIAQNIGAGCFSLLLGSLADRYGNKLAIQVALVVILSGPLVGLLLSHAALTGLHSYFWITYFILGMTPVVDKAITNYALEIVPITDHAQALSTLKLCMMVPLLFSIFVGIAVDLIGFTPIFLLASFAVLLALWNTRKMIEPRHGQARDLIAEDELC